VKDEDKFDAPPVVATTSKKGAPRGKKAAVKEEPAEDDAQPEDTEPVEAPEVKQPAKRGRKKTVKRQASV